MSQLNDSVRSPRSAQTLCRELFGFEAVASELPSYADVNFVVTDRATSERFVLKLASPSVTAADLALENAAMRHLADAKLSIHVPKPMSAMDGADVVPLQDRAGAIWRARLVTYLDGRLWSEAVPASAEQLHRLGYALGEIDLALAQFDHEHKHRHVAWDLRHASDARASLPLVGDEPLRDALDGVMVHFENVIRNRSKELPFALIHNDANDNNILLTTASGRLQYGIVDFGDLVYTWRIAEIAVAAAYLCEGWDDPLEAICHMVCGYHEISPLQETEVAVLRDLILMRLAHSLCNSAEAKRREPDNSYLTISEAAVERLFWQLLHVPANLAMYRFREACGWQAVPREQAVCRWLRAHRMEFGSVLKTRLRDCRKLIYDFSPRGENCLGTGGDAHVKGAQLLERLTRAGAEVGVGRYREERRCYQGRQFIEYGEVRNVHLGIDLFAPPGETVYAPLAGVVHSHADNRQSLDYGPTIVLEHRPAPGVRFFTLYGHLARESLSGLSVGARLRAGEPLGAVGDVAVNGGWVPHLHFQIVLDMLDAVGDFPGVCRLSQTSVWESVCPDPNLILAMPESVKAGVAWTPRAIQAKRRRRLTSALSVSYRDPLKIVSGEGVYLIDQTGRRYLDMVNNVAHVGHCHPRVVRAAQQQMARLNTNTRYLHDNLVDYTERLTDFLPPRLSVIFLVNSGSEANDLALRLARTHTRRYDIGVIDHAYHGHLSSLIDISPYKHGGPGGRGTPAFVHKCPFADPYRMPIRESGSASGYYYAEQAKEVLERGHQRRDGEGLAAFIAESFAGVGGQVIWPSHYLSEVFNYVRDLGGVCIADEVQVGFGRVGEKFWAFETQGAEPDILTMGKPIGNGHPLAAVATTVEIAASFATGMEYFNTFGGNPVSCAVGLAVLDVVQDERLQDNAREVGAYLHTRLKALQERYALMGDVRGRGLFQGVELVRNKDTLEPAAREAQALCEHLRARGILLSTDGPLHNVLKIKPPIVFSRRDADLFLNEFDAALRLQE